MGRVCLPFLCQAIKAMPCARTPLLLCQSVRLPCFQDVQSHLRKLSLGFSIKKRKGVKKKKTPKHPKRFTVSHCVPGEIPSVSCPDLRAGASFLLGGAQLFLETPSFGLTPSPRCLLPEHDLGKGSYCQTWCLQPLFGFLT